MSRYLGITPPGAKYALCCDCLLKIKHGYCYCAACDPLGEKTEEVIKRQKWASKQSGFVPERWTPKPDGKEQYFENYTRINHRDKP